jgi:hypothetical protein
LKEVEPKNKEVYRITLVRYSSKDEGCNLLPLCGGMRDKSRTLPSAGLEDEVVLITYM